MSHRSTKRERGFSLLEMVIAMAVGTIVMGAAVQLYSQGVGASWTVTQRSELQQDFRAASNIVTKDLSMAGAGLGIGAAIQLPTSATLPVLGCDQTGACHINGAAVNYPVQGTTPFLYGLIPGFQLGEELAGNPAPTDIVTVVYTDSSFYMDCYQASVASTTTVNFVLNAASANCTANGATIQNLNDSVVGLTAGDLVLFTFGTAPSATQVVAEVYGTAPTSTTVTFATGDPLKMNQAAADPKSLASINGDTNGYGMRILVITYYLDKTVTPPRLMRQVNGHSPIPVAENVVWMKFSYDLFSDATLLPAVGCTCPGASAATPINGVTTDGCATAGASAGMLPDQITKINILNMAMDSTLMGALGGYQRLDLQTSVSARNLTYTNDFPN
jgi:prepilin-type N-terminal cleavage/methylation domain-containing protein